LISFFALPTAFEDRMCQHQKSLKGILQQEDTMKRLAISFASLLMISSSVYALESGAVITGGIGEESENAIERIEDSYNTKLVFTGEGGAYLADVSVNIRDSHGDPVISGISEGPLMLANLKPGNYLVEARKDGQKEMRKIQVSDNLKTYHMRFPLDYDVQVSSTEYSAY